MENVVTNCCFSGICSSEETILQKAGTEYDDELPTITVLLAVSQERRTLAVLVWKSESLI